MKYAIFSDIHDNKAALHKTLADAERRGADRLICLGDVGHDQSLFDELQQRAIPCTFGNWEVSGLSRLTADVAAWVESWPATIQEQDLIFCHATPAMPADGKSTAAVAKMLQQGANWLDIFPRLHRNQLAVWHALAILEEDDLCAAFHGHTHVQAVWTWQVDQSAAEKNKRRLNSSTHLSRFALDVGPSDAKSRYLIGVGSAGDPQDGPQLRYALYDDVSRIVELRRIE